MRPERAHPFGEWAQVVKLRNDTQRPATGAICSTRLAARPALSQMGRSQGLQDNGNESHALTATAPDDRLATDALAAARLVRTSAMREKTSCVKPLSVFAGK
jgi:hypothetical protein